MLIVDDAIDDRQLYAEYLARHGVAVEEAVDGEHAVFKVAALLPDVVVTDIEMPTLDGIEAVTQLKAHPRTRHIPIIVLTAHAGSDTLEDAMKAGADVFLTKPCAPALLLSAIRDLLERPSAAG